MDEPLRASALTEEIAVTFVIDANVTTAQE